MFSDVIARQRRRLTRICFAFVVGVCAWDGSAVLAWAEVHALEVRASLGSK
jgi:hypothetical protein